MSVRSDSRPTAVIAGTSRSDALAATAWLLALPCAAATVVIMLLLGPPLSNVLYPAPLPFTYLPNVTPRPEPIEGTRYALSLIAPVLLATGVALVARRLPTTSRATAVAASAVQLLAAALVVACLARQREADWELAFFAWWQLLAGTLLAAAIALAARRGSLTRRRPEPRALRVAIPVLLALVAGAWFLSFVNTDQSIWWAGDPYNSGFQFDESFAVLNGLTPLVDFAPAYGAIWPFLIAPWMLLLGQTLLVFTLAMWALCIVTVLAIYGVLRRVTGSALAALALCLPIMALSFFAGAHNVHRPLAIFQEMPLRNVGPFIVAWLLARQLERGGRTIWVLFPVAGLVTINNVEFGLAALGGTVAALFWTSAPASGRQALRILAQAGLGLAGAYGLVAAITLVRAGALPDPGQALAFARIFGMGGFGLHRIPHIIGLPLVIYLTYAAALGLATVRAVQGAPNRMLTGMLAWSSIYGFGSGAYYMGESVPRGVPTTFPPWSFALALLTVAAVQHLAAHPRGLPSLAAIAALFGFGVVASFALDPPASVLPWQQVHVIRHRPAEPWIRQTMEIGTLLAAPRDPAFAEFIGSTPEAGGRQVVPRDASIALLWSTGHVIADAYGFRNVVGFVGESLLTVEQLDETIRRLRAAGGAVVLLPDLIQPRLAQPLAQRGFRVLTRNGYVLGIPGQTVAPEMVIAVHGLTKWVDERALRAPAR